MFLLKSILIFYNLLMIYVALQTDDRNSQAAILVGVFSTLSLVYLFMT